MAAEYAYRLQDNHKINARWMQLGEGNELTTYEITETKPKEYVPRATILDDLDALLPEDAEVWRAQIKAAAIKARRMKEERDRDRAEKQPTDPPLEIRRA